MKKILPKSLTKVINTLKENNYKCYLVGGATRDFILNRYIKEFDVVTNGEPHVIKSLFKNHISVGEDFGCIKVYIDRDSFEITTLRKEKGYSDFRHFKEIKYVNSIYIDSLRRDFTINSIYFNGEIFIDPNNYIKDIKDKILRSIGNPNKKFSEDSLRILRCLRFKGELNFKIHINTLLSIKNNFHLIKYIPKINLHNEMKKIFMSEFSLHPIKIFISLKGFNILNDFNLKFHNINSFLNELEFHIKIFNLLYFHSNIDKNLIIKYMEETFLFKKKDIKEASCILNILNNFTYESYYLKSLVYKFNYDFSYKVIKIINHYINPYALKKFLKIKWGVSPIKVSHISYDFKNIKNATKIKYLVTLIHRYPHLNEKKYIIHLLKNSK